MEFEAIEWKVTKWAEERGIYKNYSLTAQVGKLLEEFSELLTAINNKDIPEIEDALGDCLVVLTNICRMEYGGSLEYCYEQAYNQIKDRKGKMVNGTFVKES